jgi:hypothetical protein
MGTAGVASACLPAVGALAWGSPSWLDIGRTFVGRSRGPVAGGRSEFQAAASCSSKVSGANETREPNGEPTTTGIRPRQATSSYGHCWWMDATPGYAQPRPATVLTRLTSEEPVVRIHLRLLF